MLQVIQQRLLARLRAAPSESTVPGSLPVLFFGDLFKAHVVTVGLNPSRQEYLDTRGNELNGTARRFETLRSLEVPGRTALSTVHADRAIETMRGYFAADKPVYAWFAGLARVVEGLGASFQEGTAAHLDLAQEATDPVWSGLGKVDRAEATRLLSSDLPFLKWQFEAFPIHVVVCTSRRVLDETSALIGATFVDEGDFARLRWRIGVASVGDRTVGLAGWNIPLVRPTGLTRESQRELGELLAERLAAAGIAV
jgi:hypothetical protein